MSHDSKKMPKQGQICWAELTTPDASKAQSFYSHLFGWKFIKYPVGDREYTCFKLGDGDDMGGIMQIPKEGDGSQMPTRWISYIYVDDIDAMTAEAKKLGATIKVPATNVGDFGRFTILLDPTGAEIAFWQSLKEC